MTDERTAIYPGTFDPITNGHVDVIERAARRFPGLIVAVSQNPSKAPLFPLEERVALVKEAVAGIEGVEVDSFDGLLVDHARRRGVGTLVKGIRSGADFEYEVPMAHMNRSLTGIETFFLVAAPAYAHVSSSLVKEVARFGGDVDALVPAEVARRMKEKFRGEA